MDGQLPAFAPIGRLYDPLLQLAERIHHSLPNKERAVWTDARGYVFATPMDMLQSISPHATIGVYGKRTSLQVIVIALRATLRARASTWIVDWKVQPLITRCKGGGMMRRTPPRKRISRTRNDAAVISSPYTFLVEGEQAR